MTLSVTQLNSSQVQEVLCNQLSIYIWTDVPCRVVFTWVTLSPADRNPLTVPEPYVTGKCYACRRPPLPRKGCRSIPVDSTVNIQSTSVNIQSTYYSQHTVNIQLTSPIFAHSFRKVMNFMLAPGKNILLIYIYINLFGPVPQIHCFPKKVRGNGRC